MIWTGLGNSWWTVWMVRLLDRNLRLQYCYNIEMVDKVLWVGIGPIVHSMRHLLFCLTCSQSQGLAAFITKRIWKYFNNSSHAINIFAVHVECRISNISVPTWQVDQTFLFSDEHYSSTLTLLRVCNLDVKIITNLTSSSLFSSWMFACMYVLAT